MTRAHSSPAGAVLTAPERAEPGRSGPAELWPLAAGLLLLALLWFGPLPERARGSFAAHMVMHMGVVAVAARLLKLHPEAFRHALGIAEQNPVLVFL